jgi:hypothetical protein
VFFFAPPALVQSQPASTRLLHALSEALEGTPEALTDRRPARARAAAAQSLALWDRHQAAILAALAEADRKPLASALARLRSTQGDAAGLAALDAMEILEHRLPEGRPQWLAAADRQGMRAWILLGEGRIFLPDLAAAFRPLMARDGGDHPAAVAGTRAELTRFRAALGRKDLPTAQKAAGVLLDLVDAFEKPAGR